jgi:hypothetical protein
MHYATSRKVVGSMSDEVIEIFNLPNFSSRTMALGSTQLLIEMSTRNLPGGQGLPERKADNLTPICKPNSEKMRKPQRLAILWASMACCRDSFIFN